MSLKDESEIRELPCDLTGDEQRQRGDELARKFQNLDALEDERKSVVAEAKGKIDATESEVRKLAQIVRERREHRPVECIWRRDDQRGVMELIRTDTSDVVLSRPMTEAERQHKLALIEDHSKKRGRAGRRRRGDDIAD
jgi:hypothetical protein